MVQRSWLPVIAAVTLGVVVTGCGSAIKTQPPSVNPAPAVARPAPPPPAPPPPVEDPIQALIATSQRHFTTGQAELDLGHLERATAEFNQAIEVLLTSPYGARSEPRLREHFDRLVDRISAYEIKALAQGDAFTEKPYEAASIDQLLEASTFERPVAPSEVVKDTVTSDLQSTAHDIPIPLNSRVLSYVELFQGKLRDWIQDGLRRGAQYLPMIQKVFRAEGLPLDLAYVPLIESAFKPNAVSRAKAKGVWQFMQGTALAHGLKRDWYIDERADPEKATVAAAEYLRTLVNLFNGDWHLALASYNGGPGRIQRAMARARRTDFWALAERPKYLPRETREYVPMILAAIIIARNPAQYGFNFEPEPPIAYEKVMLARPVDLRRVAEWTASSIDEIQALNPELRRWTTPVRDPDYELKVPAGKAQALQAQLVEVDPSELATLKWYTAKRGDSLASIARKLQVSRKDLAEANYLSLKARIGPGQKLVIPRAPMALLAARTERPVPVAESRAVVAANGLGELPAGQRSDRVKQIYRVKEGDTLSSIAQLFRTSVNSLKVWNHLRGNRINVGDRLTVFASRPATH
jgi:membrane-bound lytic murein transglycosylase D